MPKSGSKSKAVIINLEEKCDVHCKSYVQPSLDRAIKAYQAFEIETTGENVTYSEAVRRLLVIGLEVAIENVKIKERVTK